MCRLEQENNDWISNQGCAALCTIAELRGVEVGRDLWVLLVQPLPEQGDTEQGAQRHGKTTQSPCVSSSSVHLRIL